MPDTVTRRNKKGRCGISSCCNAPRSMEIVDRSGQTLNTAIDQPYVEDLTKPLEPGTCITINGLVKPDCTRFSVNLACGGDDNSDIALHVNPRLSLRYVVRNTFLNGHWCEEETTSVEKFDLACGKPFSMDVFITEKVYYISINGKHHSAYVSRIPRARVTMLKIVGKVEIQKVGYGKLSSYPPQNALFKVPTVKDSVAPLPVQLPLTAVLPEGFQKGWQLEIYGRVKILPSTFFINLQQGTTLWPPPVIYFHLNPRFNSAFGRDILVSNAWVDDSGWGQEERYSGFKFTAGSLFVLAIQRLDYHFSVLIDGHLVAEFRFRCPMDKIDALVIQGDMELKGVYVRKKTDKICFETATRKIMGVEEEPVVL